MPTTTHVLRSGPTLPAVGFGTYPLRGEEGRQAVLSALATGYRLIDSAVNYRNEEVVGAAVRESGLPRDQVLVTTKLPGRHHGYDETLASCAESRAALGLDVIDLYLIHWPNPSVDRYVDSWRAMIELQQRGEVRAIGVSNFPEDYLLRLHEETGVMPEVNQVELHPYFPQVELRAFHAQHGIVTESWSPLGRAGSVMDEPAVVRAAQAHGVPPAQVVLRWHLELGAVPLPKSADPQRQAQNLDLDFALTPAEVEAITALGRPEGRLFDGDPRRHEEM